MVKQQSLKVRGIADIAFCVDFSDSMTDCIEGVKENINTFVSSVETSSPNLNVDWRIALCAHNSHDFHILDFSKDTSRFASELGRLPTGGDEFTPGAIDYSIRRLSWREVANRFLFVFTDETLRGGDDATAAAAGFPALLERIPETKTRLFYFGPKCPYYSRFGQLARCQVTLIENEAFAGVDYAALLSGLGKTVSMASGQQSQSGAKSLDPIFALSKITIHDLAK